MKEMICQAEINDLEAIKEILTETDLPTSDLSGKLLSSFLILKSESEVVACVGTEIYPPYALLRSLAVRPAFRKRGRAERLLSAIEYHLISKDVKSVYLLTTTAEKYFSGKGYARTDRKTAPPAIAATNEFSTLCPASAVCMIKHLRT